MMKKTVQPREIAARKVAPMFVKPKSIYAEEKSKSYPAPPPSPSPDDFWGLKLKMPEGGTVILRKYGSPNAFSLEVSTDGTNWQPWELVGTDYSYTLQAGETLCIRNQNYMAFAIAMSSNDYVNFVFDRPVYASGQVRSLFTRNENVEVVYMYYGLAKLFYNCSTLVTAPEMEFSRPETPSSYSFYQTFYGCSALEETPILYPTLAPARLFQGTFSYCSSLRKVTTYLTSIEPRGTTSWLYGVAPTGDFYCPAELTIPTSDSGIPNGWTRHDIE